MMLNLGSGYKYKEGYVNIDADPGVNPDIVRNIEQGLPFSDNTVTYIITEHFLEHVNPDNIYFVMREIWRVLKPGGKVDIVVPIGKGWMNSPEHKTPFDHSSHLFFTDWVRPTQGFKFSLSSKEIIGEDIREELHMTLIAEKGGEQ